jgi:hypothetical protein
MRPASIVSFERFYLGGLALGLIGTALAWRVNMVQLAVNPATAPVAGWMLPATTVFTVAVTLLLWYFIAHRASLVAKWIMVALTVLAVLLGLAALAPLLSGRSPNPLATALSLAATALQAIAAAKLFRADAKQWFGETAAAPGSEPLA